MCPCYFCLFLSVIYTYAGEYKSVFMLIDSCLSFYFNSFFFWPVCLLPYTGFLAAVIDFNV